MSRPIGVTILASLQFFYSGFGLLFSLAILLIKPFRDGLIKTSMQMLTSNPQFQGTQIPTELMQGSIMIGAGVSCYASKLHDPGSETLAARELAWKFR
jgi:hypothetical protein